MSKVMFCTNCGHVGATKTNTRGSFVIEIILWLCFLVPGLIYSIWRLSTRGEICLLCHSPNIIPPNAPFARNIIRESTSEIQSGQIESSSNQEKSYQRTAILVVIAIVIVLIAIMNA